MHGTCLATGPCLFLGRPLHLDLRDLRRVLYNIGRVFVRLAWYLTRAARRGMAAMDTAALRDLEVVFRICQTFKCETDAQEQQFIHENCCEMLPILTHRHWKEIFRVLLAAGP